MPYLRSNAGIPTGALTSISIGLPANTPIRYATCGTNAGTAQGPFRVKFDVQDAGTGDVVAWSPVYNISDDNVSGGEGATWDMAGMVADISNRWNLRANIRNDTGTAGGCFLTVVFD